MTSTPRLTRRALLPAGLAATLLLAACGSGDPLAAETPAPGGTPAGEKIVVGSADFTESRLLAQIYHGALAAKGVDVGAPRLGIGAREAYLRGLDDGSINVIPEYTGALALSFRRDFAEKEPEAVYTALTGIISTSAPRLTMLKASAAEDKDSLTVTKATAEKYRLSKVSDLVEVSRNLTLGAPAEFKNRPQGVPGLAKTYGITFKEVRSFKGTQPLVQALANGQIDAANVFTTDPAIEQHGFVVLDDDRQLFGSQNIVPLLTRKAAATANVEPTLNAVSEKLTTEGLRAMLKKVDIDKQDTSAVAQAWLSENGLG